MRPIFPAAITSSSARGDCSPAAWYIPPCDRCQGDKIINVIHFTCQCLYCVCVCVFSQRPVQLPSSLMLVAMATPLAGVVESQFFFLQLNIFVRPAGRASERGRITVTSLSHSVIMHHSGLTELKPAGLRGTTTGFKPGSRQSVQAKIRGLITVNEVDEKKSPERTSESLTLSTFQCKMFWRIICGLCLMQTLFYCF